MGHVKMMAAAQPFISGAISKTVNLPESVTVEDIADVYTEGWKLGLKALAIYRDGSKTAQALKTDGGTKTAEEAVEAAGDRAKPARCGAGCRASASRSRTSSRSAATRATSRRASTRTARVGEIFLTDIGQGGLDDQGHDERVRHGDLDRRSSTACRSRRFVRKFAYMRFEPEGITGNPEIPFAKSMPDYIMRWLASRYGDADLHEELGILTARGPGAEGGGGGADARRHGGPAAEPADGDRRERRQRPRERRQRRTRPPKPAAAALTDEPPAIPAKLQGLDLGPACAQCGGMMQRTGSCYTCSSCGNNTGCG